MEETKKQINIEESSLCYQMVKEQQKTIRLIAIAFAAAVVAINIGWLLFINGYAFETVEIDSGEGPAFYQNSVEGDNTINGKN